MIQACCTTPATAPGDLAQLFLFGLVMSAGHCAGMCGPLIATLSLPSRGTSGAAGNAACAAVYHAGRVASYALLGAVLGALGSLLPDPATAVAWQATFALLAAAALGWIALALFDVFPLASLPFAARASRWMTARLVRARGSLGARFGLGVANGLLPCGPVYTAAVAALASAGPARGAVAMVAFGAGTIPLLVAMAFGVHALAPRLRASLQKLGAALALLMAGQLALRGLAALELVPHARIHEVVLW